MKRKVGDVVKDKFKKVKKFFKENTISAWTAIFLGIATLLVAWAGWIGALHEGNQAGNYTESNNTASEGNAEYNVATQVYISDLFTWNTISTLQLDKALAEEKGDLGEAKIIEEKIEKIKQNNCSPKLLEAMNRADVKNGSVSPFEDEEFTNSYFEVAKGRLEESQKLLKEGNNDNLKGDSYELVSVLYSLVLFLLGIIGVLNDNQTRKMLLVFSVIVLILSFLYMLTIPMPTGFDLSEFFKFG
ncbi:hypothetical protein IJ096_02520 [Candidatus Saccharibacteria bacterium]|nr:hypothetical protein [Candidatus Saccharibacteria bacterium]